VASDAGALMVVCGRGFLVRIRQTSTEGLFISVFRTNKHTAVEVLWALGLFPFAVLVVPVVFLPRFLGVWLVMNGCPP
jgi:hypothetical protein